MPIDRIVVAGGGITGWLAASMLARALDGGTTTIAMIEAGAPDDSLGVPTAAETLSPRSVERSAKAGYDENALIRATRGTFALGTALSGWRVGPPGFIAYGPIGAPMGPVAFHQLAARLRHEGATVNLANFTLAALCAQAGRFTRPIAGDHSVLSTLEYGINVETAGYRDFLRADAQSRGVTSVQGHVASAERNASGLIDALLTTYGERVAGDLFIDALGPTTPLSGAFESWSDLFPCRTSQAALHRAGEAPLPFTHVEAGPLGWRRSTPLQGAAAELRVSSDGDTKIGRRTAPWQQNAVALGGAAAVIDPVAGTQFDLALSAIDRLIGLLPNDRACAAEAVEYNRQTIEELDGARDAAIMFYKGNGRFGDPMWDTARDMPVPERVAHKIALFKSCGRTALYDGEMLDEAGWVGLFEALGIRARRYDALANGVERSVIDAHFARIREVMLKAVAALPAHGEYLREMSA